MKREGGNDYTNMEQAANGTSQRDSAKADPRVRAKLRQAEA